MNNPITIVLLKKKDVPIVQYSIDCPYELVRVGTINCNFIDSFKSGTLKIGEGDKIYKIVKVCKDTDTIIIE